MEVTRTIDGKEYKFRILDALEYDSIVDSSETQSVSNRKLVTASTGLVIDEKVDRPTYAALLVEFHKLHAPKGLSELFRKSTT